MSGFVREMEGLDFPGAVKRLSGRVYIRGAGRAGEGCSLLFVAKGGCPYFYCSHEDKILFSL